MVTKDEVLALMRPVNKIGLIKGLRSLKGFGLKDAKEAVEAALVVSDMTEDQMDRYNREQYEFVCNSGNYTPDQLLEREHKMLILFGLLDPVSKTVITAETRMKNALNFAIDNWKVMGFDSARSAANTILMNF